MRTYVKKYGKLEYIGEGTIYSKKGLILREDENGKGDGYLSNAVNVQDAAREAQKKLNQNSTLTDINMSGDDATSGQKAGNNKDATLTVNTKSPDSIQQTQNILNHMSPEQKSNVDVTFKDGAEGSTNESRIREMRMNSVPFTKRELSSLLKRR